MHITDAGPEIPALTERRLDLDTSLVAPELRDKLFRVDPRRLTSKLPAPKTCDPDHVARLVGGLIAIGVFTPVLLDSDGDIIAGHGLVAAAIQLDLDDIPALAHDDLTLSERKAFAVSMARFFHNAGLDHRAFRAEARHTMALTALLETIADKTRRVPEMARA